MRELGYVEGQNVTYEARRHATNDLELVAEGLVNCPR
jgi:hypothetical protein